MRSGLLAAVLVVLVAGAAVAGPDPQTTEVLVEQTRDPDARVRRRAATELAMRVSVGAPRAAGAAMKAMLTDDIDVRALLVKALTDGGALTAATAARIPTLATLTAQLAALVRAAPVPAATSCAIDGVDPRGATLTCLGSMCRGGCIRVRTVVRIRAEARWTVLDTQSRSGDDGSCGCCMHLD
jgi:hypothetical protein